MDCEEAQDGGTLVLIIHGRIDGHSAPSLQERLFGRIAGGTTSVVLDCAATDFVSSAGLRTMLAVASRLRNLDNGRFAVCGLDENLRGVFRISGFDTIIDIYPDRATALAQLG